MIVALAKYVKVEFVFLEEEILQGICALVLFVFLRALDLRSRILISVVPDRANILLLIPALMIVIKTQVNVILLLRAAY